MIDQSIIKWIVSKATNSTKTTNIYGKNLRFCFSCLAQNNKFPKWNVDFGVYIV